MQIIIIAVLIVITGLIGALLACATSLINRARAANTTLRRIEDTLLALNRVKAIDSAIKSPKPVKQSSPAEAGSAGYLTLRELKTMSGRGGNSADSAPIPSGRKPLRTRVPASASPDLQGANEREQTFIVHSAEVGAHATVVAALNTKATDRTSAGFNQRESMFQAWDVTSAQEVLQASESPSPDQQILSMELRKGTDEAMLHVSQMAVAAVAEKVPTENIALPMQEAGEAVEEAPIAISHAIREMLPEVSTPNSDTMGEPDEAPAVESVAGRKLPEFGHGGPTAPKSDALDEVRRKKREQETLMIISSRRRRARAGR